jgi:hypothetical protein
METHDYEKLIKLCEKNNDINYWIQALNYFISISHENMKNYLQENIKLVLDKLMNNTQLNSMILLQIINKHSGKYLEFGIIKDYMLKWVENQQKTLKEEQIKTENNNNRIEQYNNQINDLITKSKTYSMQKCESCKSNINLPYYYFTCGHAYHFECLGGNEDDDEIFCITCNEKINSIERRIADSRMLSNDHNAFFSELKGSIKKFDLTVKYFGKGIFLNEDEKKEENENKNEENNNNIIEYNNDPYKN